MSMWVKPIFDRTSKDIESLKKLKELLLSSQWDDIVQADLEKYKTHKGALNACDLNRIEGNIEYLNNMLVKDGWTRAKLEIKTDWNMYSFDDINIPENLRRIRDNIQFLINEYSVMIISFELPNNMIPVDYVKINKIEKMLNVILERIKHILLSARYAGEEFAFDRAF